MITLIRKSNLPAMAAASLLSIVLAAPAFGQANTRVWRVLRMFDIDGNGIPDVPPDTDGDGLPDSWESGGLDPGDSSVPFPAPQAIVPGTPPTPIFNRLPVRTNANARDTDGDGLTDFVEVFGLKFIDDNHNGILDDACARDATGNVLSVNNRLLVQDPGAQPLRMTCDCIRAGTCFILSVNGADGSITFQTGAAAADLVCRGALVDLAGQLGEWYDFNGDGMPSIGECPAPNVLCTDCGDQNDFDGFIYTDPANFDTDNDGTLDGADNEPLINPRAFGVANPGFATIELGDRQDTDGDNDGLGNGMDLGNDGLQQLDNPSDLRRVLEQFRRDVLGNNAGDVTRVPEALLDDLLGADWNGDGLFRLTDMREPHFGFDSSAAFAGRWVFPVNPALGPFATLPHPNELAAGLDLFVIPTSVDSVSGLITASEVLGFFPSRFPDSYCANTYHRLSARTGATGANASSFAPLGYQAVVRPTSRDVFLPDPRIWTVLYASRMPGFDVDGDGFIGYDPESFQGTIAFNERAALSASVFPSECSTAADPASNPATIVEIANPTTRPQLNGQVEVSGTTLCAGLGLGFGVVATLVFLPALRSVRSSRR